MSYLCGWFNYRSHRHGSNELITSMTKPLGSPENTQYIVGDNNAIAVNGYSEIVILKENDYYVGIIGNPYYDAGLRQRDHALAQWIVNRYREKGPAFVSDLKGRFALAILNESTNELFLCVDRIGINPLYYAMVDDCIIFGSNTLSINAHPLFEAALNPQAIFNYIHFHMVPGPDSVFFNQTQLLPGQYLHYKNNNLSVQSYWTIEFFEKEQTGFTAKKSEFLSLLTNSLNLENTQNTGTFLSGGTDSSTVTGILSKLVDHPVKTFSIGFDAEGYDESYYSRLVSKHFNTDHHEYNVTPQDVLEAVNIIASTYDKPFGNASAIPTYYCAKLAAENGVNKLLAGDGGDELFGGNSRYAKQHVFSHYTKIPTPVRTLLESVTNADAFKNSAIARKASRYIEQSKVPMPDRLESYNLINFIGAETIFERDFLSHIDQSAPVQLLRNTYSHTEGYSLINRMLALDMYYTLSENDLPKVTNMCHQANIDVGFPLLNDDLVNFSLHLPPRDKLRGQKLRYFFKKALSDLLPEQVITKKKHGFGLPYGIWLNSYKPLKEMSMDSISDLKKRKIIKSEFIDKMTGDYLSEHAGYYGTLIWVLLILERWLKHHEFSVKF